ncbi:hypothetical protein NXV22_03970 [Bacteroides thetaiotaomicron]|nr:hypothetical protein [Bacteroides thetaiotaomicron]
MAMALSDFFRCTTKYSSRSMQRKGLPVSTRSMASRSVFSWMLTVTR